MKKVLVTDSLFIFEEHEKQLRDAGYEVERLDKPNATEDELIEALKGKVGYVLGGIERVTDKVLESTDELKAIAFTGADYKFFIPGWQTAKKKGIAIADAPGVNSGAVAEFAVSTALMMQRNLLELGRTGEKTFETAGSFEGATIGVIGVGNIGIKIIKMVSGFDPAEVLYYNRSDKPEAKKLGAKPVEIDELATKSDVILVSIATAAGNLLSPDAISKLKKGTLVVSISPKEIIDFNALLVRLKKSEIRAAIDWPAPNKEFEELPLHIWFNTNDHTAFNTHMANKLGSDIGTTSLINMLETGKDEHRVI